MRNAKVLKSLAQLGVNEKSLIKRGFKVITQCDDLGDYDIERKVEV